LNVQELIKAVTDFTASEMSCKSDANAINKSYRHYRVFTRDLYVVGAITDSKKRELNKAMDNIRRICLCYVK